MCRVCLNGHDDFAPDVEASSRKQDTRGESATCKGMDVIVEVVNGMIYQFEGNGREWHCRTPG